MNIPEEFTIMRQGKQYVLFAGLLNEAHNRGLRHIETELVQEPTAENNEVAVCKARVTIEDEKGMGKTFSGIGDASPASVGRNIVPHIIRMAETRAKARALRDAINVGTTALEELIDEDTQGAPQERPKAVPPDNVRDIQKGGARKLEGQKATKAQLSNMWSLASKLWGEEEGVAKLEGMIEKRFGISDAEELHTGNAQKVIDGLKKRLSEQEDDVELTEDDLEDLY